MSARRSCPGTPRGQRGVMLIEALLAVVIFAIGLLALIGLQSVAIRETTEAKMRTDASYIADFALGDIAARVASYSFESGTATDSVRDYLRAQLAGCVDGNEGTALTTTCTINSATNQNTDWGKFLIERNVALPGGQIVLIAMEDTTLAVQLRNSLTVEVRWTTPGGARVFRQSAFLLDT